MPTIIVSVHTTISILQQIYVFLDDLPPETHIYRIYSIKRRGVY